VRLLAIDQGSRDCGAAYFTDDRVEWTRRFSPPDGWPWGRRMRWITDALRAQLSDQEPPDVVAIEDVMFGVNAKTAVAMGEARGWFLCALDYWYPGIRAMAIHPSTVKSAVAAPRSRAGAKQHTKWAIEALTGLTGLSEDEADAVAIGLAAINEIKHAELLARAGITPTPKPRRRRTRRPGPISPQLVLGSA